MRKFFFGDSSLAVDRHTCLQLRILTYRVLSTVCTDSNYICDFSNGNICGIRQHTDDYMHAEWELVNATKTPDQMTDHTTGLDSGKGENKTSFNVTCTSGLFYFEEVHTVALHSLQS